MLAADSALLLLTDPFLLLPLVRSVACSITTSTRNSVLVRFLLFPVPLLLLPLAVLLRVVNTIERMISRVRQVSRSRTSTKHILRCEEKMDSWSKEKQLNKPSNARTLLARYCPSSISRTTIISPSFDSSLTSTQKEMALIAYCGFISRSH